MPKTSKKPKKIWPPCPKCDSPRGEHQWCKNGCETYSAQLVGTGSYGDRSTRGAHYYGAADKEY